MIETRKLTKYYGTLGAVVDLDLVIREGDIFGFIGPNGAGKTTTMRILATLVEPTRGTAFIDGLDVRTHGREVRRRIGYMPDFMGVYDDLKVFEYLEFFAAAYSIPAAQRPAIIRGVLDLTDLAAKSAMLVDSLSRGMQQRLQLARVLIHDPKVLILDEPASGLDPRARIEIRALLKELKRMGKTIMISSHILSELAELCDHFGIIERGRLLFSGTFAEIRQRLGVHRRVRVRVAERTEQAVDVLAALPAVASARQDGEAIAVNLADGSAAGSASAKDAAQGPAEALIADSLVRAGFKLVALVPEEVKLDDAFMELTKGAVQ
jgi:ABC-2 type transport system ATP-binding protein